MLQHVHQVERALLMHRTPAHTRTGAPAGGEAGTRRAASSSTPAASSLCPRVSAGAVSTESAEGTMIRRAGGSAAAAGAGLLIDEDVFIPHEFLCPISCAVMEDPVQAEDGHSYSRKFIQQWLDRKAISPLTRQPMGVRLTPNRTLEKAIAEVLAEQRRRQEARQPGPTEMRPPRADETTRIPGDGIGSLNQLATIFAELDGLRDLFKTLDGWQPPQIVVVGNENSGKSTLLERLCMMPIFPHDEHICTRMRIEVRMRRGEPKAPQLKVLDNTDGSVLTAKDGVPTETANVDVREEMERLIRQANRSVRGVTADRTLVLEVQSPHVPTLDLIDLPGIVAAHAVGEPEEMPQQTYELASNHIDTSKDHSIFLACVDATTAPNASKAFKLLVDKNVTANTVGVITKADEAGSAQQKRKLRSRLTQDRGSDVVPLRKHGYVCTMNAPVEGDMSNIAKLFQQAENETQWFAENEYEDCTLSGLATTKALLMKIQDMYLAYVKETWVPNTRAKLQEERDQLNIRNKSLGVPAAHGDSTQTGAVLERLRSAADAAINFKLSEKLPGIIDWLAKDILRTLSETINRTLNVEWSGELSEVTPYLERLKDRTLRLVCEQNDTIDRQLVDLLRDALTSSSLGATPRRAAQHRESPSPAPVPRGTYGIGGGHGVGGGLHFGAQQYGVHGVGAGGHFGAQQYGGHGGGHGGGRGAPRRGRQHLWAETFDSFKLERFPRLLEAVVDKAAELLGPCKNEVEAFVAQQLEKFICVGAAGVQISHDFDVSPPQATVVAIQNRAKLAADVVQVFAATRLAALQTQLGSTTRSIVDAVITEHTKDTCDSKRLKLLAKLKAVSNAELGILHAAGMIRQKQQQVEWPDSVCPGRIYTLPDTWPGIDGNAIAPPDACGGMTSEVIVFGLFDGADVSDAGAV